MFLATFDSNLASLYFYYTLIWLTVLKVRYTQANSVAIILAALYICK